MAKKETEKKTVEVCNSETEIVRVDKLIVLLADNVADIHKRIDRIVAAISKSKSVKGL